ncbi:MAG: PAS domain S-box-containing protein [Gammaproteobacteria bacterium]|jgi:PAS domain S-box-containing protein
MDDEALGFTILNSIPSAIALVDAGGAIVCVNDSWAAFGRENGASDALIQGVRVNYLDACRTPLNERPHTASVGLIAVFDGALDTSAIEYPAHSPTEQRWFMMTATPYKGSNGQVVISHVEITQRKKAELRSESSDHIVEESLNEIYVLDGQTLQFIRANRTAWKNLGYSMDELRGMTATEIKPVCTLDLFKLLTAPEQPKVEFETTHVCKNGTEYPVSVNHEFAMEDNKPVFVAVIQNITARKLAERSLLAAHAELEDRVSERTEILLAEKPRAEVTLSSIGDGVIAVDANGTVEFINPVAEQLTGWTLVEAKGQSIEAVFNIVNEEGRTPVESPMTRCISWSVQC